MDTQLTHLSRFGGCGAKIGPGDLSNILCGLDIPENPNVIAGLRGFEDAGVYLLRDDLAIVQTVDFFTPVVNDPYSFGQIAAANALSDIYAMGATPITALNIVCFSPTKFDVALLREILKGGIDKMREAGASLLGGHTVDDEETKYGLSVTGLVDPGHLVRNEGARPGDLLILTKPLGTGMIISGIRANRVSRATEERLTAVMSTLNRHASEAMLSAHAHAATDVTGFGLAGHLKEMIKESLGADIYIKELPHFHETKDLYLEGFLPRAFYKNRDFYAPFVETEMSGFLTDLVFDPQSSGGLLIALASDDLAAFSREASNLSVDYWVIGCFTKEAKGKIRLV